MSVSAFETREAKLMWLLRPIEWASCVCFWGSLVSASMWFYGDISTETIATIATATLFVTLGLIFWSIVRVGKAARGR